MISVGFRCDRDETINYKWIQQTNTKNWMKNKWTLHVIRIWSYQHMLYVQIESVIENETNEILWDVEIQTDNSIPASKSDQE